MGCLSKGLALVLILTVAISCLTLLTVKPASAQTIPVPSVPQFTLQLIGPPFTFNTTYSLDPNTGKIVADLGYTNQYSSVVLTIENQPFDASYGALYYNVRIENQNTQTANGNWYVLSLGDENPEQTAGSEYTKIPFSTEGQGVPNLAGTKTDIQVQAMLGSYTFEQTGTFADWEYVFTGSTSNWSNSQTISVPANVPLGSPSSPLPTSLSSSTPTSTPATATSVSISPFTSLLLITNTILLVVIAILLAVIIVLVLRHRKTTNLSK